MSLIRRAIDLSTSLIGRLRRSHRVIPRPDPADGQVKINLGCGLAVAPGWTNIDASLNALVAGLPPAMHRLLYRLSGANRYYTMEQYCDLLGNNRFVHHDLAHSIPLADSSADYVYSSHFLEHLFRHDAENLIRESFRVLKPGGTVRICIPDLEYAVSLYAKGDKKQMLDDYFFVDDMDSFLARHKYMYDFGLLSELLEGAGFTQIVRCDFAQGDTPDLKILDNRPDESLFVEAKK